MRTASAKFFLLVLPLLAIWWIFGCYQSITATLEVPSALNKPSITPLFDRSKLIEALNGDEKAMQQLVDQWEAELKSSSFKLNPLLVGRFKANIRGDVLFLPSLTILDDCDKQICLDPTPKRFLPQTYASATILLALLDADQIVALPRGLRDQSEMIDPHKMAQITLDTDRYCHEQIHLASPDLSFVAHYTLPATRRSLEQQGVKLFDLNSIESPEQIVSSIQRLGQACSSDRKAQLLADFVRLTMERIDIDLKHCPLPDSPIAYISWYDQIRAPTHRSVSQQLLDRLGVKSPLADDSTGSGLWSRAIDAEQLIAIQPKVLLIAAPAPSILKRAYQHKGIQALDPVQMNCTYFIDDTIQNSPTQFIALALFDLYHCLKDASFKQQAHG